MSSIEIERFHHFFEDFSRQTEDLSQAKEREAKMLRGRLEKYSENFKQAFEKWRSLGGSFNIWNLAFKKVIETECTRILAWFLDAQEEHGQGNAFFKEFLNSIDDKFWYKGERKGERPELSGLYSVKMEKWTRKKDGRMDLVIEGKNFYLVVEVKTNTEERDQQLRKYKEDAATYGKNYALVYLTKKGEKCDSLPEEVQPLSWGKVGQLMMEVLNNKDIQELPQHSPLRLVCRDFCKYITTM